jgi:hypothetical protein
MSRQTYEQLIHNKNIIEFKQECLRRIEQLNSKKCAFDNKTPIYGGISKTVIDFISSLNPKEWLFNNSDSDISYILKNDEVRIEIDKIVANIKQNKKKYTFDEYVANLYDNIKELSNDKVINLLTEKNSSIKEEFKKPYFKEYNSIHEEKKFLDSFNLSSTIDSIYPNDDKLYLDSKIIFPEESPNSFPNDKPLYMSERDYKFKYNLLQTQRMFDQTSSPIIPESKEEKDQIIEINSLDQSKMTKEIFDNLFMGNMPKYMPEYKFFCELLYRDNPDISIHEFALKLSKFRLSVLGDSLNTVPYVKNSLFYMAESFFSKSSLYFNSLDIDNYEKLPESLKYTRSSNKLAIQYAVSRNMIFPIMILKSILDSPFYRIDIQLKNIFGIFYITIKNRYSDYFKIPFFILKNKDEREIRKGLNYTIINMFGIKTFFNDAQDIAYYTRVQQIEYNVVEYLLKQRGRFYFYRNNETGNILVSRYTLDYIYRIYRLNSLDESELKHLEVVCNNKLTNKLCEKLYVWQINLDKIDDWKIISITNNNDQELSITCKQYDNNQNRVYFNKYLKYKLKYLLIKNNSF